MKDEDIYNLLIWCLRKLWRATYLLKGHDFDWAGLGFSWGLSGRALVIKGFGGGNKFGR